MRSGARSFGIAVDLKMDLKEHLVANLKTCRQNHVKIRCANYLLIIYENIFDNWSPILQGSSGSSVVLLLELHTLPYGFEIQIWLKQYYGMALKTNRT